MPGMPGGMNMEALQQFMQVRRLSRLPYSARHLIRPIGYKAAARRCGGAPYSRHPQNTGGFSYSLV
jgi:hypothetical protein